MPTHVPLDIKIYSRFAPYSASTFSKQLKLQSLQIERRLNIDPISPIIKFYNNLIEK